MTYLRRIIRRWIKMQMYIQYVLFFSLASDDPLSSYHVSRKWFHTAIWWVPIVYLVNYDHFVKNFFHPSTPYPRKIPYYCQHMSHRRYILCAHLFLYSSQWLCHRKSSVGNSDDAAIPLHNLLRWIICLHLSPEIRRSSAPCLVGTCTKNKCISQTA